MTRRGRAFARAAAFALLPAFVASCAPSHDTDPGVTLAVMLQPGERPFWIPIVESFERARPGVRVNLVEGPQSTDLRENLYTAALLAGDASFDLVYMDVTWTSKFAAAGWLRPLDDAFGPEARAGYLDAALAAGIYRDRLYRIPVRTDVGLLYYRSDWLEEAGLSPPETFEALREAALRLQRPPERWGFVWQGKQYEGLVCAFLEVLGGFGGFWIDERTLEVGLDRPEAEAALAFLAGARAGPQPISPPGVTTYQEEESRRLFQDGRAVFLRNWPYAWRLSQREDSPLRGRVGAVPMVRSEAGRRAGTLGGWGLGVSAFSRHPEMAIAFIRHVTSMESQRALCAPTGYAPALRAAYEDPELLEANPFLTRLLEIHRLAVPRPVIARYALASDILQRHLSAALAGAETPGAALSAAARETRRMLGPGAEAQAGGRSGAAPRVPDAGAHALRLATEGPRSTDVAPRSSTPGRAAHPAPGSAR
jgi:multiple sugar transport system substrate-binding protein